MPNNAIPSCKIIFYANYSCRMLTVD